MGKITKQINDLRDYASCMRHSRYEQIPKMLKDAAATIELQKKNLEHAVESIKRLSAKAAAQNNDAFLDCSTCKYRDSGAESPCIDCTKWKRINYDPIETSEKTQSRVESCEDCISRQAAYKQIERFLGYLDDDMIARIKISLSHLPSVQPERKKGHWIEDSDPGQIIGEHWRCSECHVTYGFKSGYRYCPNCGAEMEDNDG